MTFHRNFFGGLGLSVLLPLVLLQTAGWAFADGSSFPVSQQHSPSQDNLFQFSDEFSQQQADNIGKHWTDCHSVTPAHFEPLGILDDGVVVKDPKTRPGVYGTTPTSGHAPTNGRMYPGIGCAFMETGAKTLSVKVLWSGNHGMEHEAPVSHVEGAPLLFISPDNPRYGFGVWPTELFGRPALLAGYIGSPPELFEVIASGLIGEHETGKPREVEVRVEKPGEATIWVDGKQVHLYQGFGLNPIPIDKTMINSTLHGFALDAHFVDPVANTPKIKGIESIKIEELGQQ